MKSFIPLDAIASPEPILLGLDGILLMVVVIVAIVALSAWLIRRAKNKRR